MEKDEWRTTGEGRLKVDEGGLKAKEGRFNKV